MEGKENTKSQNSEEEFEEELDENQQSGNDSGNNSGKNKPEDKGKSFTQDQITRMMTREKSQGRAAAYKEMGIDPKNKKMVDMFQAFIKSQKSDEQLAAEKDAEMQSKQQEAEHRAMVAEAKAEAMMLGVKSQYVEDAVTLALSRMTDSTDLKTILSELKDKYSIWFEEKDGDDDNGKKNSKVGQKGTGSSVKETTKKNGKENNVSLGARLAARRKPATKTSYWGTNN